MAMFTDTYTVLTECLIGIDDTEDISYLFIVLVHKQSCKFSGNLICAEIFRKIREKFPEILAIAWKL